MFTLDTFEEAPAKAREAAHEALLLANALSRDAVQVAPLSKRASAPFRAFAAGHHSNRRASMRRRATAKAPTHAHFIGADHRRRAANALESGGLRPKLIQAHL